MRDLPDALRVPFVLVHFEQVRYDDIADALGTTVPSVKLDVQRGRETLRALLASDGTG